MTNPHTEGTGTSESSAMEPGEKASAVTIDNTDPPAPLTYVTLGDVAAELNKLLADGVTLESVRYALKQVYWEEIDEEAQRVRAAQELIGMAKSDKSTSGAAAARREQLLGQALGDLLAAVGRPLPSSTGPELLLATEEAVHEVQARGQRQRRQGLEDARDVVQGHARNFTGDFQAGMERAVHSIEMAMRDMDTQPATEVAASDSEDR